MAGQLYGNVRKDLFTKRKEKKKKLTPKKKKTEKAKGPSKTKMQSMRIGAKGRWCTGKRLPE